MSKDMKMNIQINGDNRGFKRSLNDTERDMKQFQQSPSFMSLNNALNVAQTAALAKITGFATPNIKGLTTQVRGGGALENLRQGMALKRHAREEDRLGQLSLLTGRPGNFEEKATNAVMMRKMGGEMMANSGRMMAAAAVSSLMAASGAASFVALAVGKSIGNQNRRDKEATQFSAPVLMHQAMRDQAELQLSLKQANDPRFQSQQKRKIDADYMFDNAGTGQGASLYTEAEIFFKRMSAAIIEQISTGNPMAGSTAFYNGGVN